MLKVVVKIVWGLVCGIALVAHAQTGALKSHRIGANNYIAVTDLAKYYGLGHNLSRETEVAEYRTSFAQLTVQAERREIHLNGVQHWLSAPVLDARGQLWVTTVDLLKAIDPVLRLGRNSEKLPVRTVVIDAGHGGTDRGTHGHTGVEKEMTIDVARRVERLLTAEGVHVVMTRKKDETLTLQDRVDTCDERKGDLFVSIHFNSGGSADGIETYCVPPAGAVSTGNPFRRFFGGSDDERSVNNKFDERNVWLAHCVQKALLEATEANDRGVRRARFFVLRLAPCPAILVEGGFLTNRQEEQKILTPDYRERLAKAIVAGIVEYRNSGEK